MLSECKLLEDESLVAELRKRRNSIWNNVKNAVRMLVFIVFVILYAFMVLAEPHHRHRDFRETMRGTFDTSAVVPINNVDSIPGLWSYFNHTLLPSIMHARITEDSTITFDKILTGKTLQSARFDEFGTQLIGSSILVRTFRVKFRPFRVEDGIGCRVDPTFIGHYVCYPPYSEDTKSTANFGRGKKVFQFGTPDVAASLNVTSTDFPSVHGQVAEYSGAGFLMTFSGTLDDVSKQLDFAIDRQFVDLSTRAVMIEFNSWAPNEGFIGVVRIMFEISVSGNWVNTFNLDVIGERYLEPTFDSLMVVELFMVLFLFYYLAEEFAELLIKKSSYLKDGWNLVDWANLVMLMIFVLFRVQCFANAGGVMNQLNGTMYTDLSLFANYVTKARNVNAFNTVLVALKVVKYVSFIPYVTTLIWTLRSSWKFFVSFVVIYLSVFIGFSLAYNIGFGEKFAELSSFSDANLFLARSFAGDVDLTQVYESSPGLGGILIIMFIAVMYFLCMNLFYSIMISALGEAKIKLAITGDDQWKKFITKSVSEVENFLINELEFDKKIGQLFPKWAARRQEAVNKREAMKYEQKQKALEATIQLNINDGGPSSLHCGRIRKKRREPSGQIALANIVDSSSDSEVDLGPLSKTELNRRKRQELQINVPRASEPEIYFQAIEHMAAGLEKRGEAIQDSIVSEMRDLQRICASIHVVLEVLVRRSQDINSQQANYLRA
eukprot:GEMP01009630.1.p1 GENE.GEMP01009630.1~~GEMP01009630.1.p1  ORF type:complete len:735 (+),score=95.94 GEMP01009630.1:46-2205(+)